MCRLLEYNNHTSPISNFASNSRIWPLPPSLHRCSASSPRHYCPSCHQLWPCHQPWPCHQLSACPQLQPSCSAAPQCPPPPSAPRLPLLHPSAQCRCP